MIAVSMGFGNTEIHREAIKTCQDFKQLFDKYSKCHNLMNSSESFDEQKVEKFGEC